ncbi:MAG: MFS transporter, partial [Planctomycetes bacterium]|nr:MFS transporter [Planctomycetota bacterium]
QADRVSALRIIRNHWPGAILLVGVVFSLVFCLISIFLERLAEERGFRDIKVFFLVYCPTAIMLRLAFRRIPEQLGRTRTVVGGLVLQAVGIFSLVGISTQWQLILPAVVMGAGHCFVFPSMIDLAAGRLPDVDRGIGTSLILGAGDLGTVIGFFVMGEIISRFGFDKCLTALAITVLVGATFFAYCRRRAVFRGAVGD